MKSDCEQRSAPPIRYRRMKMKPIILPPQLAIGWLTMFLVGTELFVFSPLLPMLCASYAISAKMAGLCITAFALAYMVSAPLFGHVSDRFGRRRVLICCLLAFGTANLCTATAPTLPALLAARLFAGAAAGGVSPTIYALVSGAAPPDRRASWLALSVSGLLAALAFGASLGGLIGAHLGWTVVFGGLASVSVMLAWLNMWVWSGEHRQSQRSLLDTAAGSEFSASLGTYDRMEHGPLRSLHLSRYRPERNRLFCRSNSPSHHVLRMWGDCRDACRGAPCRPVWRQICSRGKPRRSLHLFSPAAARAPLRCSCRPHLRCELCGGPVFLSSPASRTCQRFSNPTQHGPGLEQQCTFPGHLSGLSDRRPGDHHRQLRDSFDDLRRHRSRRLHNQWDAGAQQEPRRDPSR